MNDTRQIDPAARATRLPTGRLTLGPVVDALLADGMLSAADAERAKFSARQGRAGG